MEYSIRELVIDYYDIHGSMGSVKFTNCDKVADTFRSLVKTMAVETMTVFCLDTQLKLISVSTVAQGTVDRSTVHPRDVFRHPIGINATNIILAHNHPSGCLEPSDADLAFTRKINEGSKLLGIKLLDHVIVSRYNHHGIASTNPSVFN